MTNFFIEVKSDIYAAYFKELPMTKSQGTYESVLEGLRKLDPTDRKKPFQ